MTNGKVNLWKKSIDNLELRKALLNNTGYFLIVSRCLKIIEKVSFHIASEVTFKFECTKVNQKCEKWVNLGDFLKSENLHLVVKQCYHTL